MATNWASTNESERLSDDRDGSRLISATQFKGNMNMQSYLTMMITHLAMQLPVLLVCLGAGALILVRWKEMGPSGVWALCGFGLGAVLCLLIPAVQAGVIAWVNQSGNMAQRAWVFQALSVVWSILHAVCYAFLLVALLKFLKGRGTVQASPSN